MNMFQAVMANDINRIKFLAAEKPATLMERDEMGRTPLEVAMVYRNVDAAQTIVAATLALCEIVD